MTLKSNKIVPALKAAAKAGVDVDDALDQLTELVEAAGTVRPKITTVLTTIGEKSDGSPLVVGWSTCGECKCHVSRCNCPKGPVVPSYVAKWVEDYETKHSPEAVRAELSTDVSNPDSAEGSFPAEGVPDSADSESESSGAAKQAKGVPSAKSRASCKSCGKPVLTGPDNANADKNDDGSWTCFDCQEGGN
jgi:hypothetical protein